MRVIAFLAAVLLASLPYFPTKISPSSPQILLNRDDCEVAPTNAQSIAHALGFLRAHLHCDGFPAAYATLDGRSTPYIPAAHGLIALSGNERWPSGAPPVSATAQIPSDIPFIAASGSIIGYAKLDALLLWVRTENPLRMAFALEDAGISRADIVAGQQDATTLLVRVRPLTAAQIERIAAAGKEEGQLNSDPVSGAVGFISDCNAIAAALGALAVKRAREHAQAMAYAAAARLGQVIGVVDSGASIPDAVCGVPRDASLHDLVVALRARPPGPMEMLPQLYGTLTRSVNVAWKLDMPPNPPGRSWQSLAEFEGNWWQKFPRPAFVADGLRVHGFGLISNAIEPNAVTVMLPDWTLNALRRSPFAADVSDAHFGISPLPAVDLRARSASELKVRLNTLEAYLAHITRPKGAVVQESLIYRSDACGAAIDAALGEAVRDAISKVHGRLRYLDEYFPVTSNAVSCTFKPDEHAVPARIPSIPSAWAAGDVVAGY